MKGSLSVSILSYLDSLKSFPILSSNKFSWLLICSSTPLLIGSSALVSIAAPPEIAQVIAGGTINRPNLKSGSQGESVSELQAALKLLGFYTGPVDGIYQENTVSAVSRFKQAAGLTADGVVDNITWQRLFPNTPIVSLETSTPKSTPATAASLTVPSQSRNISRVMKPSPEPRPAQPRQTTTQREPRTTSTRTTSPRTTPTPTAASRNTPNRNTPNRNTPTPTRQTQTTPSRTTPTAERNPSLQYTQQGMPILRLGNRGAEVVKLQERLQKLGFLSGSIDGDFGATTEAAVKAVQTRYGLEPDGVVGGATWDLLLQPPKRR